jgi:hypothetical protein
MFYGVMLALLTLVGLVFAVLGYKLGHKDGVSEEKERQFFKILDKYIECLKESIKAGHHG